MRRNSRVALMLGALLAGAPGLACGPDETPRLGLEIHLKERALVADISQVELRMYQTPAPCAEILGDAGRAASAGPWVHKVSPEEREKGFRWRLDHILAGSYSLRLDARAASGTILAQGCAEGQVIDAQKTRNIRIQLHAL